MANKTAANEHGGFPWKHLIGFVLSIVLTLFALWIALETDLSLTWILIIIFGFAFLQAALQLLMFMHVTENSTKTKLTGRVQVGNILFAAFIAIIIVAGSVWVMTAGHAKHDKHDEPKTENHGGHGGEEKSEEHGSHK
ncbi:cytochrome aa3 quinol oxidase subunit IV [Fictibacillus phosphorivorans]|uniref:cytochrome aa3 quinol oxidase subunit IV n=1 Tax=Fictibacillus phosphorivorans TaxID=1221500 RepID=UPI00203D01E6|nr:cytochrome aa3 quinol oxidase subunit IV [Fictibacillus phosphorivorans]MCM3719941.1 cytochrome aa3 quinol oxidase subunit IV [Fictibacillus phosphorivorans]MCM3777605.1 cytochrome aa3 quinol oxidase subunit IV [Fictibacillus phosphorivorans]